MRKRDLMVIAAVLGLLSSQIFGQPNNTTLISHWDQDSCYQMELIGDLVYCSDLSNEIKIVALLDPYEPEVVGYFTIDDGLVVQEMLYFEPYLLLVVGPSEDVSYLHVIDVSVPSSPTSISDTLLLNDCNGAGCAPGVAGVTGNVMWWSMQTPLLGSYELFAIDLSNPMAPVKFWGVSSMGQFQYGINGSYLFADNYDLQNECGGFSVLDVSNPQEPDSLGLLCTPYSGRVLDFSGNHMYVEPEYHIIDTVRIFDVHTPEAVDYVGAWDIGYDYLDIVSDGRYLYVPTTDSGIRIFDAFIPEIPVEVGYFDPGLEFSPYLDSYSVPIRFHFGGVIVGARESGFYVFRNDATVDIESNKPKILRLASLQQNQPNPFNPSTIIRYGLPEEANVSLVIYDVRGQVVQTIASEYQSAGWYDVSWNGESVDGHTISTGIYFARLVTGDYSQVIKMLYLK